MTETTEREEKILSFWKKHDTYTKLKKQNATGKPFYLMDGPPYANGHIHMGTALNKILKDVTMRSRRMQGQDVFDRPGYDTHGVPIEFQVEKEIGSKNKKDIQAYGVKKFIERCKHFATQHIGVMNNQFADLGVWMPWENPYLTLSDEYVETIWDALKTGYEKKLLYEGKYPVHVCTRCETAVAFNEIEYGTQQDKGIFVKFPLKKKDKTFLIIWTTTPWTLPGNMGVMVHPDVVYSELETSTGERWIMAEELTEKRMTEFGCAYKKIKSFKGKEMEGWAYENPLGKKLALDVKKAYKVILSARYVTTTDGTGLVHCAPGHGKEDYDAAREYGLDIVSPVQLNGVLTKEAGAYAGLRARADDGVIVEDLKKDGLLVYEHVYSHDYPLCWRCKTPLLMMSIPQWFLRISKIQKKLIAAISKVTWLPAWTEARMKAWLEGISDWPISRERYWGTPLPIWVCNECKKQHVVGSIAELKKLSGAKTIGVHVPEIDAITIPCSCGGSMKRVSSVFDVWFDSGVSSWAALDAMNDKKAFERYWPADVNIEGPDQFRGWWNSQLILSHIKFGKNPYKNIAVHGLVLDIGKRKMSKSLGNVTAPADMIAKYGRDQLRYYLIKFSRGEDFAFNEKEFAEIQKVFTVLSNINTFVNQVEKGKAKLRVEDKWILSRFNLLVAEATKAYNEFKFYAVIDLLESFLVKDLSRTYIQMIRDRADEARDVLETVRNGLLILCAPIAPFMTEHIWQDLREKGIVKEESIHLASLPKQQKSKIDEKLEQEFKVALEVIEKGLAERDKLKIGLKWPLAELRYDAHKGLSTGLEEIIARQLNVKKITKKIVKEPVTIKIEFDTKMTPELEGEGFSREIARRVQAERKRRGLVKSDRIVLQLGVSERLKKLIAPQTKFIQERTGATKLTLTSEQQGETTLVVREETVVINL